MSDMKLYALESIISCIFAAIFCAMAWANNHKTLKDMRKILLYMQETNRSHESAVRAIVGMRDKYAKKEIK